MPVLPAVPSTIVLSDQSPAVLPDALAARLEQMAETNQLAGAHQLIREIVSNLAQARPALVALIQKEAA